MRSARRGALRSGALRSLWLGMARRKGELLAHLEASRESADEAEMLIG